MTQPAAPRSPGRLVELAVTDLGIIEHLSVLFSGSMTALTGETGAGKTLLVGAIDLLLGGRADSSIVRTGATEAVVEGRFDLGDGELVLCRVVPADGRSRAYIDGRMATAGALADRSAELVDLHGQHAHQSLLAPAIQRSALDRFGATDLGPLTAVRAEVRRLQTELGAMGGDAGARAREADLLRFQLTELEEAGLTDPDEDTRLDAEEDLLADAVGHREAVAAAVAELTADDAANDLIGRAIAALDGHGPFEALRERLRAAQADLSDISAELRTDAEQIEDDPPRLAALRERRQVLVDLRRKYATATLDDGPGARRGSGTLADAIAYRDAVAVRLALIEDHDARAAALEARLAEVHRQEADAAAVVAAVRRRAAPLLAAAVQERLAELAMGSAHMEVTVGERDPGDEVAFLLAANVGTPPAPLAKVASGGELARSMLALRLVLSTGPPVLVFDEVDAGIGGEAALAVGRSLARLAQDRQVLVVTHLAQVAAFADQQVQVTKAEAGGSTTTDVTALDAAGRVVELSRMLAGTPGSAQVNRAAQELLELAEAARRP